ncbi:acyl-protein thioesterase, partial [Perkinsus olseni]
MNPPISTTEDDELFLKEMAEQQDGGVVMGRTTGRGGNLSNDANAADDALATGSSSSNNNNSMLLGDILQTLQRSEALLKSVRDENSELRTQLGVLEQQLDRTRENLRDLTARKLLETTSTTLSSSDNTKDDSSPAVSMPVNDAEQDTTTIGGSGGGEGGDYAPTVGASEDDFIMAAAAAANNNSNAISSSGSGPDTNHYPIPWSAVVKGVFTDTTTDTHHTTPTLPVDAIPTADEGGGKHNGSDDDDEECSDDDGCGPWPLWRILDMLSCIPDEQVVCVKKIQLIKAHVSTVLRNYFSSYGHVVTILLLQRKTRSHTSTLPPNMGFVVMSDPNAVKRILHNPEHNIQGNLCETTSFQNKRKVRQAGPGAGSISSPKTADHASGAGGGTL